MEEISQILDKNEKVLWHGKPNFLPFVFGPLIIGIVSLFFFGIFLLIFFFYSWLVYKYIDYAITNKRVIIKSGLIGRDFKTVDYDKITNVEVNVSIWDKLLAKSSGTICIFTAGTVSYGRHGPYQTPYRLSNIPEPYKVFKFFKKVSFDVKTDMEYPNKYRPRHNPGYNTGYSPPRM